MFDIANNWMSNCTENHDLCKNNGDGTLPTRLISIAGESLRLVLTSKCLDRPRYAALSHSWGSYNVIKLTSGNLDTYMEALPVERFPRTFKEAIEIIKKFGLNYLWIDSLCIIQDSVEDWQNESALMSSVFGGSTVTIAASSARDGTEGCFMKPPHFSGGLRARINDGGLRRVQDFRSQETYDLSTIKTHLGTRAWALQERILPPRTIHFGDRGAFWECRTTFASEDLPDGLPRQLVAPLVSQRGDFQDLWHEIVRHYSGANLTFAKDKLPALSGVARLGYNETGDLYLAGLWRDKLDEQLCWFRSVCQPSSIRPRPAWRAPTWSWASIEGQVCWHPLHKNVLQTTYVHILDSNTTKYGYDPFGQVTSGVIRLACFTMAAGYLVHTSESNNPEPKDNAIIELSVGDSKLSFSVQMDCQDESDRLPGKLCYLLPFFGGKSGNVSQGEGSDWINELLIKGIVLQATDVTKGEFSRIGSFCFYKNCSSGYKKQEETFEGFLRVLKEHGRATAKAVCSAVISNRRHIDKRYIITLV